MEKHVYFVRHGESEENATGIYQGPEVKLTERGREQAHVVAERIAHLTVEAVLSSAFPRALQTAEIIGECIHKTPEPNELFAEWIGPAEIQGKHRTHPEPKNVMENIRNSLDPFFRHDTEETFHELCLRATKAIETLEKHNAVRLCVVTHGGFLKILTGVMIFREEFNKAIFKHMVLYMPTTNTGITYLKTHEQLGWRLVTWNDQSHLG